MLTRVELREMLRKYRSRGIDVPLFLDFAGEVLESLRQGPDGFWNCHAPFTALVRSNALSEFVQSELRKSCDSPTHLPVMSVLECPEFTLTISCVYQGAPVSPTVASSTRHRMIGLAYGGASARLFEQLHPERNEEFDRQAVAADRGTVALHPGETIPLVAGRDACDIVTGAMGVYFEFSSAPVCRYAWYYDRRTGTPVRLLNPDPSELKTELTLHAVRELASPDSPRSIRRLLTHPNHFIRWSAVKALLELEREDAAGTLAAAAADPHPQVRAAAHALLAGLSPENSTSRKEAF